MKHPAIAVLVVAMAGPAMAAGVGAPPAATPGVDLLSYGPVGALAVVMLAVLTALYKMNEKARDNDAGRIKDQLTAIQKIAEIQQETGKAQAATVTALSVVTSRMDDLVRDLREMVSERRDLVSERKRD